MQADLRLLGSTVESLVTEFDQEKFEKLLSGSISPKAMRQYRKVSSETRFQVSSETFLKVTHALVHKASSVTFNEILKTSCEAHAACVNVSQETQEVSVLAHDQKDDEDQSDVTLLLKLCNFGLPRPPNSPDDQPEC